MRGVVKWFNSSKGFGFITADGKDYFAHFRQIQIPGYKELKEGQKVNFDAEPGQKGPCAVNIRPSEDDDNVGNA